MISPMASSSSLMDEARGICEYASKDAFKSGCNVHLGTVGQFKRAELTNGLCSNTVPIAGYKELMR